MTSKRDILCRDLHTLEPATLHDEQQADVQAFIDTLSIVERHRVCRAINNDFVYDRRVVFENAYNMTYLSRLSDWVLNRHK